MIRVDVVLPCLDEAAALPDVLARLPEGYRAIVVDNGSSDGSAEVAAEAGGAPRVLRATAYRTARALMEGAVLVPEGI